MNKKEILSPNLFIYPLLNKRRNLVFICSLMQFSPYASIRQKLEVDAPDSPFAHVNNLHPLRIQNCLSEGKELLPHLNVFQLKNRVPLGRKRITICDCRGTVRGLRRRPPVKCPDCSAPCAVSLRSLGNDAEVTETGFAHTVFIGRTQSS